MIMKFTTVEQAVSWLDEQTNPIRRVGINKIRCALSYLGNPHEGLPVIHITGTNGKGSTTTYLKQLLLSQGLSVGAFTSPHIMRFNERFSFNGMNISDEDLIHITEKMVDVNAYMETTEYGKLVFFELYTVMMAIYFKEKQPDVCLIEVGIGGENDCTNVFDAQLVILTTIGLDHEDLLGDTVEAVAKEKSGLIKEDAVVVTGPIQESPLQVVIERVNDKNGYQYKFNLDYGFENVVNLKEEGSTFDFWLLSQGEKLSHNFQITMLGQYQIDNASIALRAFFAWMLMNSESVDFDSAHHALKHTSWMARMERISDDPVIYIDGAHNAHGLTALKKLVDQYFPNKTLTVLYAGLSTKNQDEQLPILNSFNAETIYLTQFDHQKAMSVDDFIEVADENNRLHKSSFEWSTNWEEFIMNYSREVNHNDDKVLLITGSLYFVSDVRQFILEEVQV